WKGDPSIAQIDKIIEAVNGLSKCDDGSQPAPEDAPEYDPDDLVATRTILADEARVDVLKFIASGDVSNVYLGRYGKRFVSVKDINGADLPTTAKDELLKEVELASYLQDTCFMRVLQVILRKKRCYIVADYSEGETVARRLRQDFAFSVQDTV